MSKLSYDKRTKTAVFFDEEKFAYLAHLPMEIKTAMVSYKTTHGTSFNLQIISALEEFFKI